MYSWSISSWSPQARQVSPSSARLCTTDVLRSAVALLDRHGVASLATSGNPTRSAKPWASSSVAVELEDDCRCGRVQLGVRCVGHLFSHHAALGWAVRQALEQVRGVEHSRAVLYPAVVGVGMYHVDNREVPVGSGGGCDAAQWTFGSRHPRSQCAGVSDVYAA